MYTIREFSDLPPIFRKFNDMVSNPGTVHFKDATCEYISRPFHFFLHRLLPQIIANTLELTILKLSILSIFHLEPYSNPVM